MFSNSIAVSTDNTIYTEVVFLVFFLVCKIRNVKIVVSVDRVVV
jgi:hypothetical protein